MPLRSEASSSRDTLDTVTTTVSCKRYFHTLSALSALYPRCPRDDYRCYGCKRAGLMEKAVANFKPDPFPRLSTTRNPTQFHSTLVPVPRVQLRYPSNFFQPPVRTSPRVPRQMSHRFYAHLRFLSATLRYSLARCVARRVARFSKTISRG